MKSDKGVLITESFLPDLKIQINDPIKKIYMISLRCKKRQYWRQVILQVLYTATVSDIADKTYHVCLDLEFFQR